ncbi:MAG: hypothetical protein WCR06_03230 [bacterium]
MKRSIIIVVLLVGRAFGGWLNPSQPGFTADETLLRIAGDRTNAAALTDATNGLWRAFGAHNHDGRYDAAGVAEAVNNQLSGDLLAEGMARAAFDSTLLETNSLVLYGQDLYRQMIIDDAPGWLDWQILTVDGQPTVMVWAYWANTILNRDGSVDSDQIPDFGGSDYGQFAWILDADGNYRVPQEWHDGDHFANIGPDATAACYWNGNQWWRGQTTMDGTLIDAVDTGYNGSDYMDWYGENQECPVTWHVSEDRKHLSYSINWQSSPYAPPFSPWYVSPASVQSYIRIAPMAEDAFVWDGYVPGYLFTPDGNYSAWLGYGPIGQPVEMQAGWYFGYTYYENWPSALGETAINLDYSWMYGFARHRPWIQVPTAAEVTNTVQAAITGDQTRYLKGEVDGIAQSVRDDLGGQVQAARNDLGAWIAASTNLLTPALAGQFLSPALAADTNRVLYASWSNSPIISLQNTNALFLALPPMLPAGQAQNLYFDCLGTNTIFFAKPVLWASAPPAGKGLYQLFGNASSTNVWRGWAVPETRVPVAYTQFVYSLPPQGPISNGLFASPVSVTLGNGATSNALPATVAVLCKEQTTNVWTAYPLSRTNLYAGDVYLPFGLLKVAFSNSADNSVTAMPPFTVSSSYFLEPGAGLLRGYPAWDSGAWYFNGTTVDGTWSSGGGAAFFTTGGSVAPGFTRGSYRTGSWGYGDADGCVRSPALTGLVSRVRMMIRVAAGGLTGLVEYCPLTADWTQRTSWTVLPGGSFTSMDWNWITVPVNKTNGYIRIRNTPVYINAGTLNIAFVSIE